MNVAGGLLDFYILEASEYVDQLDALVGPAVQAPPNSTPFVTAARALRGSSTMAKLLRMAELAGCVERVGRALRDGSLRWTPDLRAALVAAIDDLRILLRAVRAWGAAEEQRAASRIAELRRMLPDSPAAKPTPISGAISPTYFASEVEAVASALDAFAASPAQRDALDEALGRVRALRGITALKDIPPLADVADAIEQASRLEAAERGTLSSEQRALYDAAAGVLRRAARELRVSGRVDASAPEVRRFAEAAAALQTQVHEASRVVPIGDLFFGDAGPHLVSRAEHPPSTPDQRYRTEITGLAEHVRRLVAEAAATTTGMSRDRAAHELRLALRSVHGALESFGYGAAARFFAAAATEPQLFDPIRLASVDAGAALVASPNVAPTQLADRLSALGAGQAVDRAIGTGFGALDARRTTPASTPVARPSHELHAPAPATIRPTPVRPEVAVTRRTPLTPTGPELHQFLQSGIAGFSDLNQAPLAAPAPLDDATLIPIEDLLYRGRAALERAIEVRDLIRLSGGNTDDALAELFDLLDLAAAE